MTAANSVVLDRCPTGENTTMNQTTSMTLDDVVSEARSVQARLQELWADEGVEQLEIFLDPDIYSVLNEIKAISMDFISRMAELTD